MKQAVIVDCIRTPMGRSKAGIFRNVRARGIIRLCDGRSG